VCSLGAPTRLTPPDKKSPFFKRRTAKKRQAEDARRARSMMQQPNLFPSVPKDPPK
jgi:hypothetical protein